MRNDRHIFTTEIFLDSKTKGHMKTGNGLTLPVSSPPEFGGSLGSLTPEDSFVGSVNSCYMLTMIIMAGKLKSELIEFTCRAEGILERPEKGGWHFSEIRLYPVMTLAKKISIPRLLELCEKYCLVTASIKCKLVIDPKVTFLGD